MARVKLIGCRACGTNGVAVRMQRGSYVVGECPKCLGSGYLVDRGSGYEPVAHRLPANLINLPVRKQKKIA